MKLEDQVVSRPVAEKLAEKMKGAGIKMECLYKWAIRDGNKEILNWNARYYGKDIDCEYIPAPTLTEMLSLLPGMILIEDVTFFCSIKKDRVGYWNHDNSIGRHIYLVGDKVNHETACAILMIWLIDNGYVGGTG